MLSSMLKIKSKDSQCYLNNLFKLLFKLFNLFGLFSLFMGKIWARR